MVLTLRWQVLRRANRIGSRTFDAVPLGIRVLVKGNGSRQDQQGTGLVWSDEDLTGQNREESDRGSAYTVRRSES